MLRIGSTARYALLALTTALVFACSSQRTDAPSEVVDASAGTAIEKNGDAHATVAVVSKTLTPIPTIADRFAPNANGFQHSTDGVTSPGWRGAWTERAYHVGARLAPAANQPFEAGLGVSELYRLKLQPVGANAAALAMDEGRAVYRDAFPATDVTFAAAPDRVEWAYTLRDESAPSEFKLRVELPKHLVSTRLVPPGALEFLDAEGHALLRVPRPVAVDAAGTQRDAALEWNGKDLVVKLDRAGLQFPIVLDPAIETVVWEARVMLPDGRYEHSMAYDSARKRIVLFGGHNAANLNDTWEYDGVAWSLRATSGPTARFQAAMAYDAARGLTTMFGGTSGSNETWNWNGTAWNQVCMGPPCSSTRPSARQGAGMAYDAARSKLVLFGGLASGSYVSDTWTWDGTAWAAGPSGPSARAQHMMTYDTALSRVLMIGGTNGSALGDLWAFNGTSWTTVTPSGGVPPARYGAVFIFENAIGKALLYGGASGPVLNDTWEYNVSTNTWASIGSGGLNPRWGVVGAYDSSRNTALMFGGNWSASNSETWEFKSGVWSRPAGDVGARAFSQSAYDSWRNRTVVFSGGSAPPYPSDTWEWTGFSWTQVCTTAPCSSTLPGGRVFAGTAYDSARRQLVMFGGNDSADLSDTWEFNGDAWVARCTSCVLGVSKPSARSGSAMAYDATNKLSVLFGGSNGAAETWVWNGAALTWTKMSPGTSPGGRQFAGMTFDPDRNKIVMFGGMNPATSTNYSDTWEWDVSSSNWSLASSSGPSARRWVHLAYDTIRKKTVLFGGRNTSGGPLSDTWEWNGSAWTQTATVGPDPRYGHTLDYDVQRRRTVAFGGIASASFGDTWEYYTRGGSCSVGSQCATGFCVDGVCCEQVSCGTCMACNLAGSPGQCAPVTSADDPDTCPAATNTCDATGACKKKQAQTCTNDQQCASTSCANGFCCDTVCTGGCNVCDATPGTCTLRAKGANGIGCGAYFCDGVTGTCPSSCTTDTDCGGSYYCAADGTCQSRRSVGKACDTDAGAHCKTAGCRECAGTNVCKDGFCCSSACTGSCLTCAATPGTCTTLTSADDTDSCTGTNTCSSSGTCLAKNGQTCTLGTQCASGNCIDGFCCNSACSGGCDVCSATPGTCTVVAQGSSGASPACGAYVCNGSSPSCPASCGSDADCSSSYYCGPSGTCLARKAQGSTCNPTAGVDCRSTGCRVCSSGNCIDGFCCDSACGGSCDACNGAALGWSGATNGTCAIAPVTYAGSPACVAYSCSGTSATCATGCTSDVQCANGYYCNAAGACVAQKAQGASCNLTTDCKSGSCRACGTGNCIDGYCCNTACGGQCQACDVAGALGSCVTVTGAVHGSRTACSGSGACAATCNGVDATACKYAGSSIACGTTSCASGAQTNVGTCNGAGTCNQSTTPCGNYACSATTCKTSCTADSDCASSSYFCSGGACVSKKINGDTCSGNNACTSGNCVSGICCDSACTGAGFSCGIAGSVGKCAKVNGAACTLSTECGSGQCVDGVCCNSSCGGQCQACNVAGSVGTCSNVIGTPVGTRAACGGTGAGSSCGSRCDGTSATSCAYPGATTSCSSASCASGVETTAGTCNGSGTCSFTTKPCGAYTCGSSSCKSTCAGDTDCAGGFYCKLGVCAAKEILGASCTVSTACASGNCVDGVCCSTSSCGTGLRCNLTKTLGTCAKPNGAACTVSTECSSSFCVDGVCCDTGCNSQCAACDVTGKVGTCSAVTGTPHGSRSACSGAGAGTECGRVCDGTDMIACKFPTASKSCGANSCTSSGGTFIEKHTSVCDGAGACSDEPKTCVGYTCGTTACKTGCSANTDCATGFYCKTGACVPIEGLGTSCTTATTCTSGFCTDGVCCAVGSCGAGKSCSAGTGTLKGVCVSLNGTACSADAECASGVCADGVCCDGACNGSCEACNKAGSVGKCVPIVGDPLTGHPACGGTSTDSDCASRCDGTDGKNCKFPGTTSVCGKASCGGGVEVQVSTCDGAGTCKVSKKTCSPYVCGPTACLASCTKNEECGAGNYCKTGSCVKVEALGKTCGSNAECDSGFCTDGVCCSAGSCGEGSSCAAADSITPGACLKKKGVACTKADDCATGRCVDGFCCDLACNGQCEACDVSGSEGTCTPVVGSPHGTDRTACDTLEAKDCAKAQCDGKTRDKCGGFANGGTTSCGMASCTTDKRYQGIGACDGAGKCAMPEPKNCTPYGCDAAASSGCKSICANDDDCAADFKCEAGACIQGAKCSDDRSQSIDKAGVAKDCKPYRCGSDGKCATACATSDDCASGTACDSNAKACVIYTVDDTGGDGGCGCTTPGSTSTKGAWALGALIGLALLRRRATNRERQRPATW